MKFGYKYNTLIGCITIIEKDNYITDISLSYVEVDYIEKETNLIKLTMKQLSEYFNRKRVTFDIPILLNGSAFQNRVLEELIKIPYGKTVSYEEIAMKIKNPKAVRAVGNAIGSNPLLIIVPCHRVINKNGNIGGFSCGVDIKRKLHKIEGINL